MKSAIMPSTNQKLIDDYVKKGATKQQALMFAALREIELKRREIVDNCRRTNEGRSIADAKFRKYFKSQLRE